MSVPGHVEAGVHDVAADRREQPLLAERLERLGVGGVDVAEADGGPVGIVGVGTDAQLPALGLEHDAPGAGILGAVEEVRGVPVGSGDVVRHTVPVDLPAAVVERLGDPAVVGAAEQGAVLLDVGGDVAGTLDDGRLTGLVLRRGVSRLSRVVGRHAVGGIVVIVSAPGGQQGHRGQDQDESSGECHVSPLDPAQLKSHSWSVVVGAR